MIELGFDLFYDLDSENIEKDNGHFCLKNLYFCVSWD